MYQKQIGNEKKLFPTLFNFNSVTHFIQNLILIQFDRSRQEI